MLFGIVGASMVFAITLTRFAVNSGWLPESPLLVFSLVGIISLTTSWIVCDSETASAIVDRIAEVK